MDEIERFLTTPPGLRFAFAVKVKVGPIQDLGQTARGHRRIVDILGGEALGPRFQGEILPGGADWQIVRPDGTIEVVARYTIRSETGALVYVQNDGLRVASAEVLARMSKGELVPLVVGPGREAVAYHSSSVSAVLVLVACAAGIAV